MALTNSLVKDNTGCYRYVERFDITKLGNRNPLVAQSKVLLGNAGILGTHNHTNGFCKIGTCVIYLALLCSTHNAYTRRFEILERLGYILFAAHGKCVQRTCRCLDCIGVHSNTIVSGDNY